MSLTREVVDEIKLGLSGNIRSIPLHYSRMGEHLTVRPRLYTIVGGDTGSGKSGYVDETYLLRPYEYALNHPDDFEFHGFLFSLERHPRLRTAKWMCHYLYKEHKILID